MKVAITGAFSYSGRYLAKLLLDAGHTVVSLSSRFAPIAAAPLTSQEVSRVEKHPLDFDDEKRLGAALEGCCVLWCTYWIRFERNGDTFAAAADRCARLFEIARQAGVRRIVYTSHTHATEDSPFVYIAGKARAASALRASGVASYAIARPCGIFGDTAGESILMNNAAWVLRRAPLFLLAGDGQQRFQPIHVRDMAQLLLELGALENEGAPSEERDACGPDKPTAVDLFQHIASCVHSRAVVSAPGMLSTRLVTQMTKPINWYTGDVILDTDDLDLLCSGLTQAEVPEDPAISRRRSLFTWLEDVGPHLGNEYISSMQRYYYQRA
ncbi:unnamed protein product [Symbiodinium natans]|uniref:NAD-dependent epimerase/dehydratase domain-containing protein n=1 Tax=Symbiodinium natans TaxID=878477 RepID=A0A812S2W2_9DINO|nr:unnamed protein product [Symbiodinium natans]